MSTIADPFSEPTRRRLFATLAELGRAASTHELAERVGRHPNGVRIHLARLHDAGLVERQRTRGARGRPRDEWAVSPGAEAGGTAPRADDVLARWLARAIPATPARLREVERTGRDVGRELAPDTGGPVAEAFGDALTALGFRPSVVRRDGRMDCVLGNCPYRDSVLANQPVVCTLHQGLTKGLLDRLAPGARLVRFVPHDPDPAGCEVEVHGLGPA